MPRSAPPVPRRSRAAAPRLAVAALAALLALPLAVAGCAEAEGHAAAELQAAERARAAATERAHAARLDSLLAGYRGFDQTPPPVSDREAAAWADSVLAGLTLDQKIGQLFIVDLKADWIVGARSLAQIAQWGVGGFHVARAMPPARALAATNELQRVASVPLFFTADFESGAGQPTTGLTELPTAMAIGASRDPGLAEAAGAATAIEARAMGVNVVFAPTADVNNNPDNPIINTRSFGESPALVGEMAAAWTRGAQAHGALATLKHFPGHGNTATDTHVDFASVPGTWQAMARTELAPYRIALAEKPGFVMSAHLWMRALDREPLPATFSRRALSDVLRDSLGFEGIVTTDAIHMGALKKHYSFDERMVRPLEAGADVILNTYDPRAGIRAIRQAVDAGRLTEARIDQSVRRILIGKARLGLHRQRERDPERLRRMLAEVRGAPLARAIAEASITEVRGGALPLRGRVALVQTGNFRAADRPMTTLERDLGAATTTRLSRAATAAERRRAVAAAQAADVAVVAFHLKVLQGEDPRLTPGQRALVEALVATGTPVVLAVLGNPYAAARVPETQALVVAYDPAPRSATALADVLRGRRRATGTLPVTLRP